MECFDDIPDDRVPRHFAARLRTESWTLADGRIADLLVAEANGHALAHAIVLSPRGCPVSLGGLLLSGDAMAADREALLSAIPLTPALPERLNDLGILSAGAEAEGAVPYLLAVDLVAAFDVIAVLDGFRAEARRFKDPYVPASPSILGLRPFRIPETYLPILALNLPAPIPAPPAGEAPRTGRVLDVTLPHGVRLHPNPSQAKDISDFIDPWLDAVRARLCPDRLPCATPATWSVEAFAHYSEPFGRGRRRSQAAALHPAFAGLLALDPELVRLVDDGRPFESRLAAICDEVAGEGNRHRPGKAFGTARVRRLRSLPPGPVQDLLTPIERVIRIVARLPVWMVPEDARAWRRFIEHGMVLVDTWALPYMHHDHAFHLMGADWDIPDIVRHHADPGLSLDYTVRSLKSGLEDMLTRAGSTLASVVLGPHYDGADAYQLAADALLDGHSLRSAWRLQERWHRDLPAFDALVDYGPDARWDALFDPFDAGDGILVRCLTTPEALLREGSPDTDPDGVAGLGHCVGGYARDCLRGVTHVAGVTQERGGRVLRLSTLEMGIFAPVGGGAPVPGIRQHAGMHNHPPPKEAAEAVATLIKAIRDGRVPVRAPGPDAALRAPDGKVDPDRVFRAWRPFMRKPVAEAGVAGLRERFRGRAGAPRHVRA